MTRDGSKADRRHQRVSTPKGVWVAWQNDKHQNVSRVPRPECRRDVHCHSHTAAGRHRPAGVDVRAEGEIRGKATVRSVVAGEGMGVQFTEISAESQARLDTLVARLLMAESNHFCVRNPLQLVQINLPRSVSSG